MHLVHFISGNDYFCGDVIGHVIGFEMLDSIEQLLEKCK